MTTETSGRRKRVVILGATGSIGESALKVARDIPERMEIVGLAANSNAKKLAAAANETRAQSVCLVDETKIDSLKRELNYKPRIFAGQEGLLEIASLTNVEMVLIAIVGTGGLRPALAAIEAGKDLAVASKEILVMAGEIVMREARDNEVNVLPVDSEHNAIFQCLEGKMLNSGSSILDHPASGIQHPASIDSRDIRRIILTASGGPFRETPRNDFDSITPEQALKHPTWDMGPKITIDSATLFNKGLEMIEARWLFDIEMGRVDVVVHPQSVVHSMVEFVDGSMLAQLSTPDMCLPIQYALTYPERASSERVQTNLARLGSLTFEEPDAERFPAISLARKAGEIGGTMPAVLNAANEVAVDAFVNGRISFPVISETVSRTMAAHKAVSHPTLDQILEADGWARKQAGN